MERLVPNFNGSKVNEFPLVKSKVAIIAIGFPYEPMLGLAALGDR